MMRYVELTVGGFMIMGIIAIVLMAFRVSGISVDDAGADTYTLKARFDNLGGLTERAKVSMAGVPIGRVTNISLDNEWYAAVVEMEINQSMDVLTLDTSASILTAGLLGEKYIGLEVGGEIDYLEDGDWIEETQSAVILEELISQFLFNTAEKEGDE